MQEDILMPLAGIIFVLTVCYYVIWPAFRGQTSDMPSRQESRTFADRGTPAGGWTFGQLVRVALIALVVLGVGYIFVLNDFATTQSVISENATTVAGALFVVLIVLAIMLRPRPNGV